MRILYMLFLRILHMIDKFQEQIEFQYVIDSQMETLFKMTHDFLMKIKQQTKEISK